MATIGRFGRSRTRAVVPLSDQAVLGPKKDTQLGVLARSLAGASRLGVVVPETWVLVADVFRHVVQTSLPPGHDPGSLLRTIRGPVGVERAARARERLLVAPLESDVEQEIDVAFRALSAESPWGIAVRGSAILPDEGTARAAGLTVTELTATTREELGRAIRRVFATSMSEAALRHLRARRIREIALAVVLQPTVVARATATLVTDARAVGHGRNGGKPERLVVAMPGLAAPHDAVLAEVSSIDEHGAFHLLRAGSCLVRTVVRNGALTEIAEPPTGGSLIEQRAPELAEIARRLTSLGPSEVRCVIPERGEIAVVDVRPLGAVGPVANGTAQTLWARASVSEAPAPPLTTLSRELLSEPLLASARRALGERARGRFRAEDSLTVIEGRPYLNVTAILERRSTKDFVDPRGRIVVSGAQLPTDIGRASSPRASLARAGLRVAQIAAEQRVLAEDVARFEKDAETQRRWLAEMDLAILPDDALTTTLHEVAGFLSLAHDLHARATASLVAGHGLLASVLAEADPAHASFLAHAVTSGADVITARPASAFCHVVAISRFDEPAREWLAASAETRGASGLPEGPLSRALARFLDAFGDRGFNEAELSTPRWGEDRPALLALVAAQLRGDTVDPDAALSRARALADRRLAVLEPSLSFFESRLVRDIVSRVRDLLRLRERCRARVAHGLAMMRTVAIDVDRRIRRLDPTLPPGAAFHLTLGELGAAVVKYRSDLAPVVEARRADLASNARPPAPPPVFRGSPGAHFPIPPGEPLVGLASSPGTAEGRVVRVRADLEGLARFSPGDVLVLEGFDVGFLPLVLQAKAVVSELGTPFASSAVVARDFGVPVVTGVEGAWSLLRNGDRVHVDGDGGTVENLGA